MVNPQISLPTEPLNTIKVKGFVSLGRALTDTDSFKRLKVMWPRGQFHVCKSTALLCILHLGHLFLLNPTEFWNQCG